MPDVGEREQPAVLLGDQLRGAIFQNARMQVDLRQLQRRRDGI
jgi:hypothetical protein